MPLCYRRPVPASFVAVVVGRRFEGRLRDGIAIGLSQICGGRGGGEVDLLIIIQFHRQNMTSSR